MNCEAEAGGTVGGGGAGAGAAQGERRETSGAGRAARISHLHEDVRPGRRHRRRRPTREDAEGGREERRAIIHADGIKRPRRPFHALELEGGEPQDDDVVFGRDEVPRALLPAAVPPRAAARGEGAALARLVRAQASAGSVCLSHRRPCLSTVPVTSFAELISILLIRILLY